MESYRNAFSDFADQNDVIVLCPLFPQNALYQGDLHTYKMLRGKGVNYDEILLDMIEELSTYYRVDAERFALYGFSGGGQFSHRFLYAHPDRLAGVAIGAPGTVTLINSEADYWVGTRNFQDLFGHPIDIAAIREVPIRMLVGDQDVWTRWVEIRTTDAFFWMDGANDAGITRVARLEALRDNFDQHGIPVQFEIFPGVAHDDETMLSSVKSFFANCLGGAR
jgi:dienelactone hydrolase